MKFKHLLKIICVTTLLLFPCGVFAQWITNLDFALKKAKAENKKVLINFTGSDWCPPCIRMRNEVYENPEFKAFAAKNLILVEIDFPKRKSQLNALREANQKLASEFGITGYPTMFLLDNDGKKLVKKMGYVEGGAKGLIAGLQPAFGVTPQASPDPKATQPASPQAKNAEPPAYSIPAPVIQYDGIALKGISGGRVPMALINNKSFAAGEKAKVKADNRTVEVLVKEIRENSVLVQIEGETEPRELKLNTEPK